MRGDIIPGVSLHARWRAAERLGRDPSREDWLKAVLSIIDGEAPLLMRADTRELRLIRFGAVEARVWWDTESGMITTLLEVSGSTVAPRARRLHMDRSAVKQMRRTEPYRRARRDWSAEP